MGNLKDIDLKDLELNAEIGEDMEDLDGGCIICTVAATISGIVSISQIANCTSSNCGVAPGPSSEMTCKC